MEEPERFKRSSSARRRLHCCHWKSIYGNRENVAGMRKNGVETLSSAEH